MSGHHDVQFNKVNTNYVTQQDETHIDDTCNEDEGLVVGSIRAMCSPTWPYFKRSKPNDEVKAKCKHCSKVLVADSKNGTTHIFAYFKRCLHKPTSYIH